MEMPEIVSVEEWQRARDELLRAEKEATRALDALAARRRRLPMVAFDTGYAFDTPEGTKSLLDLFEGREQLIAYQFMDNGPDHYCPGCTWFTNNVPSTAPALHATTGRGIDRLTFVTSLLDLTVFGRQEEWEDSPPGRPQRPTARIPNTMPIRGEAVSFGRFR
jgi:predicted dithiol-disulfide oxidoreductase (DUF899 family)